MTGQTTYSKEFLESLRTVAFDVHPDILGAGAPLPRKSDGSPYTEAAAEGGERHDEDV